VVANPLIAVLILLLTRPGLGRAGSLMREVYPLLLLLALYASLDLLNGGGAAATHDRTVQAWEQGLFGRQVSREWWKAAPSAVWSSLLHGAYLSYYVLVPLPVVYFLWRRDQENVRRTVFFVMATFLACYLAFIFFPVAGPYYEFARPDARFIDNLPARLVYATLAQGSAFGAAFPSSHVAATVVATIVAFQGTPRLGLWMLVPTMLLTVGVIYTQMHYVVDVLAGLLVAGVIGVVAWATSLGSWAQHERPSPDPVTGARV
jgi:membrane-associated phospholipid phosphatase